MTGHVRSDEVSAWSGTAPTREVAGSATWCTVEGWKVKSMTLAARGATLLCLWPLLASGCAGAPPDPAVGAWTGRLQTLAGTCPDQADSDLVVSAHAINFVPGDGVLALYGKRPAHGAASDETLRAQLLLTDSNHKPLPIVFEGRLKDGRIVGTYGTPSCRATISLHPPTHTALQRLLGN